ncbi:MAG: metallophosphoesterase [Planctomycetaceae bacterium]
MSLIRYTTFMVLAGLNLISLGGAFSAQAEELDAAPEGSFSIVVIPDTQRYLGGEVSKDTGKVEPITNPTFEAWTDWIVANQEKQNIVFVSHVGDIVDENIDEQWTVAQQCMNKLHGKIPYGISVGNHDLVGKTGDSTLFQKYFPQSRFTEFDWYGGCFAGSLGNVAISGNNANSYQLFEASGMKFIALHLECNAPDDVLAWANEILEKHADRRALITTHMDLGPAEKPQSGKDYFDAPKGKMKWTKVHGKRGNTAKQMWKKSFKKHPNLFLICCGDQSRSQAMRLESQGENGNTVHELLSDYGVNGLRLMRFHPAQNEIEVITWDPLKGERCLSTKIVPDENQHQFKLQYEMASLVPQ